MGLLINGDIYIKIKPEIIEPDANEIKKIDEDLYDLSFEDAQYGITERTEQAREELEKLREHLLEQKYDYETTEEFHILKICENQLKLICFNKLGEKKTKICDIEEIKEKYIRLADFLEEAKYIGREFKQTVSFDNHKVSDYTYNDSMETAKILYKTSYAMLAEHTLNHSHYFGMIKPKFFIDQEYTFIGYEDKSYNNKKEIYKNIVDEIENRYQYYKKYYKNK